MRCAAFPPQPVGSGPNVQSRKGSVHLPNPSVTTGRTGRGAWPWPPKAASGFTRRALPVGAKRRLAPTSSWFTRTLSTDWGHFVCRFPHYAASKSRWAQGRPGGGAQPTAYCRLPTSLLWRGARRGGTWLFDRRRCQPAWGWPTFVQAGAAPFGSAPAGEFLAILCQFLGSKFMSEYLFWGQIRE